jgi:hypothetical protein
VAGVKAEQFFKKLTALDLSTDDNLTFPLTRDTEIYVEIDAKHIRRVSKVVMKSGKCIIKWS